MKINYFVLGTNNMAAATCFYDSLFKGAGFEKIAPTPRMTYWLKEDFAFALALPFDEEPASHGNGTMIGFNVGTEDEVRSHYQKAIALGGTCEGEPGLRGPRFSAYVRDLDSNKLCFSN